MAFLCACCLTRAADRLVLGTVVIDAGHGGTDPGAVSLDGKTYEKALTLDISKKLAAKISAAFPEVKVVLSRPDDKFVALESRASKANKSDAQLFISIHINAAKSSSPNGYSVHILGQSSNKNKDLFAYNMDVCKRENSVVLLENDYSTKYQGYDPSDPESFIFMQLMQNSHLEQSLKFAQYVADNLSGSPISANRGIWQNPFLVLWRTAMPAVLVELGFISNSSDLGILRSESNRDKIAECLKNAFAAYKEAYDASVSINTDKPAAGTSAQPAPSATKQSEPSNASLNTFPSNKPAASAQNQPVTQKDEKPAAAAADSGKAEQKPQKTESTATVSSVKYGTQVMSGSKKLDPKDKAFKGFTVEIVKVGDLYKYVLGVSTSPETAVENFRKIRAQFQGAFMVKYSDKDSPTPYRPAATK